eukprot:g3838.t1
MVRTNPSIADYLDDEESRFILNRLGRKIFEGKKAGAVRVEISMTKDGRACGGKFYRVENLNQLAFCAKRGTPRKSFSSSSSQPRTGDADNRTSKCAEEARLHSPSHFMDSELALCAKLEGAFARFYLAPYIRAAKRRMEERMYLVRELVRTEFDYFRFLKYVRSGYAACLEDDVLTEEEAKRGKEEDIDTKSNGNDSSTTSTVPRLDRTHFDALFGAIDPILRESECLLTCLRRDLPNAFFDMSETAHKVFLSDVETLAKILSRTFRSQKMKASYATYIVNFESNAEHTLRKLLSTSAVFRAWCAERQRDAGAKGLTLESILIQPIQRMPRYKILLRDLVAQVPLGSATRHALKRATDDLLELISCTQQALDVNSVSRLSLRCGLDFFCFETSVTQIRRLPSFGENACEVWRTVKDTARPPSEHMSVKRCDTERSLKSVSDSVRKVVGGNDRKAASRRSSKRPKILVEGWLRQDEIPCWCALLSDRFLWASQAKMDPTHSMSRYDCNFDLRLRGVVLLREIERFRVISSRVKEAGAVQQQQQREEKKEEEKAKAARKKSQKIRGGKQSRRVTRDGSIRHGFSVELVRHTGRPLLFETESALELAAWTSKFVGLSVVLEKEGRGADTNIENKTMSRVSRANPLREMKRNKENGEDEDNEVALSERKRKNQGDGLSSSSVSPPVSKRRLLATREEKKDEDGGAVEKDEEEEEEQEPMWKALEYESYDALKAAETKARKYADDDDEEWRSVRRKEKKEEEAYSRLTFEAKKAKLDNLLSKATAFAHFLGNNVKAAAESGEEGFTQPKWMTGGSEKLKLRDYQRQGAEWLNALCSNGMSGILADEMGLGKTIQVIALYAHLRSVGAVGRYLIVAPLSTLPNWKCEFERWCPDMNVVLYHGSPQERAMLRHEHFGFTKPRGGKNGTNNRRQHGRNYASRLESDINRMSYKELVDSIKHLGLKVPSTTSNLAGKKVTRDLLLRHLRNELKAGNMDRFQTQMMPIVITSYGMILRDIKHFRQFHWWHMTIDEGHRLKNKDCRLMHELKSLSSEHRLLLTGTPLQNNIVELWSLLHFLRPDIFENSTFFKAWFGWDSRDDNMKEQICSDTAQSDIVTKLHNILNPFMLRRLKRDVAKNLPSKTEIVVYVGMTEGQKELYQACMGDLAALAKQLKDAGVRGTNGKSGSLLNKMMQLRKCCNHPYLFADSPDTDEEIVRMSGKLVLLDRMLKHFFAKGHKVLIFSQFTMMLDIIEDYFLVRNWRHRSCRIDGSVKIEDRQKQIEGFNELESKKSVFLLSTRAGGVGINLASADTVIIFDSDWNPHMDNQAQDRAHRIGQKKVVFVYRFVTEGSVELKILERANNKRSLERLTMSGNFGGPKSQVSKKAVKSMQLEAVRDLLKDDINFSKEQREGNTGGITDKELAIILDRPKILKARRDAKLAGARDAKKRDAGLELLQSAGYEVVEHRAASLIGKSDVFEAAAGSV